MDEQEQIWQKRFRELARRAATRQRPEYTDFLTPAEQEIFIEITEPAVFRYSEEQLRSFVEIL